MLYSIKLNTIYCGLQVFYLLQQLFRSQQSQAATPSAAQLQLLQQQQQQQYLAAQQQQAAAAFPQPQYLVNPAQQEQPYLITAGVPAQYYNVGPWVYPAPPANLIQQSANNGARRPLTPNGTTEAPQQVQVGVLELPFFATVTCTYI